MRKRGGPTAMRRTGTVSVLCVGQDNLFLGALATPPPGQKHAPETAIRLEWLHNARAGGDVPIRTNEADQAWLPLPSMLAQPGSSRVSGCIHADEIVVSRWPGGEHPPLWTAEGAVQWEAELLGVRRSGSSLRLHLHQPLPDPRSGEHKGRSASQREVDDRSDRLCRWRC